MTLASKIKLFFLYIFTFQFIDEYRYRQMGKKARKVALNLAKERAKLKEEINTYVRATYGLDANSDYIPCKGRNKMKLYTELNFKYEKEMKEVSLRLTKNLRWR